jgi:hypothetical protein
MSAYDAFLVELLQYTAKDTLKELSYEELSRATNKVCKQIYGAKPTEDQKKEQANIKRKVKMEWKKENETEEGVIKTSMYEEKAEAEADPIEEVREIAAQKYEQEEEERLAELAARDRKERETLVAEKEIAEEEIKQQLEEPVEEKQPEEEIEINSYIAASWGAKLRYNEMLEQENMALTIANHKLHGLIDGLCIGSGLVLSGLLVIMLLYKFI